MAISMYAASVPMFLKYLDNLDYVIGKAIADGVERKIEQKVFAAARLAPDMYPFTRQVQIMADIAKGTAARLAGTEPPVYEDNEATLDECRARIRKTLDYLGGFKAEQIDGSEGREIVLKFPSGEMKTTGLDYLLHVALPNVFFHFATAYDILRHNGVKLGKLDFMMGRAQPK